MRAHTLSLLLLTPLAVAGCIETEEAARPDQGVDQCAAYPTCPEGMAEVPECPADADCVTAELCGASILCAPGVDQCLAAPQCPAGYAEVDQCPQDDVDCRQVTRCGQTIQCLSDGSMGGCEAYPVCPEGTVQVDECPQDAGCLPQTVCGYTIQCMEVECLPEFECPGGLLPVEACATPECVVLENCGFQQACDVACDALPPECPDGWQDTARCDVGDPNCQRLDFCGNSRFCVPAERCVGPAECPSGVTSTECSGEVPCEQRIMCGDVYYCLDLTMQACPEAPGCPEGMRPIDGCPPEHPDCERVQSACGLTQDCIVDMDCDQALACPEGTAPVERCVDSAEARCEWVVGCGDAFLCGGPR